jgi:hypothetical protein
VQDKEVDLESILAKYPPKIQKTSIPYGYIKQSDSSGAQTKKEGDPDLGGGTPLGAAGSVPGNALVPDPLVIPMLEKAFDQLDAGIALRVVTEWLNSNTPEGVSISYVGLDKLRRIYRPDFLRKTKPTPKIKRLTPEEKAAAKRKFQIAQEKKRITHAKKRQAKLEEEVQILQGNEIKKDNSLLLELDYGSEEFKELEQEIEVVFKPNPGPQTAFFAADEMEVLYGGAAGGEPTSGFLPPPFTVRCQNKFRELLECPRGRISSLALVYH